MPLSEADINRILEKGKSPRWRRIEVSQRYYDGSIYDGRPDFLDNTSDAAFNERKPCVIYPGFRNAVESFATMCVGEGHFPTITSLTSEDDSAFDKQFGLSQEQSADMDAGIKKILDQTRFPAVSFSVLERALNSGTACPMVSVQDGRLRITELDPKTVTPIFEADGETCAAVEVSYRFVTDAQNDQGDWIQVPFQYRRLIDKEFDTVFVPVEIEHENDRPVPNRVQTRYRHGFGFCPVHWYRFMSVASDASDIDGRPIHWKLESLCDAVNFGLSQRHAAAMYSGDPQLCEKGVDEDNPVNAPQGRLVGTQPQVSDGTGWNMGSSRPKTSGSRRGRKKGRGTVWTYESPDADSWLLTLPGDALKTLAEDAEDNISMLRESLGHVHIDPKDLTGSGDVSGKTLAFVYAGQIAKCNRIREDFGSKCLLPVLNMLFRVVLGAGEGLYLSGRAKLIPLLRRFLVSVAGTDQKRWFAPTLKLVWGDYFEASDQDESTRTDVAIKTHDAGLITKQTAVEHLRPIFKNIDNVEQYMKTLEKESEDKQAKLDAGAADLARAQSLTQDDDGKPKSPPGSSPKAAT